MSIFDEEKKSDVKVIIIGLLLISFIAAITIFKAGDGKIKMTKDETELASEENKYFGKIEKITAEDLVKKIQAEQELTLIDLRSSAQYEKEHIIDSINIDFSSINSFPNILVTKEKSYVFITQTEDMAIISAMEDIFSSKDYSKLYYLEGGFGSWKSKFNPTVGDGDQNSFSDQAKVTYISNEELKAIWEVEKGKLLIIDSRKNSEFAVGHLPGALNLPLDELEKRRKEIPRGKKLIIYDNTTVGAFKAAVKLFDLGFLNTFVLSGGIDDWKIKGYEIVK